MQYIALTFPACSTKISCSARSLNCVSNVLVKSGSQHIQCCKEVNSLCCFSSTRRPEVEVVYEIRLKMRKQEFWIFRFGSCQGQCQVRLCVLFKCPKTIILGCLSPSVLVKSSETDSSLSFCWSTWSHECRHKAGRKIRTRPIFFLNKESYFWREKNMFSTQVQCLVKFLNSK